LEKTHVYTYIARTLGRMLIAGVSSVIDDDGTMVRTRHRVDAFVPFVTAIRDVLVCLQAPIESLMRFHVPYVYACSIIERYPQFRVNCGIYDNYTANNNNNNNNFGRRRRNQQPPGVIENFFAIGKEEANAIANIRNNGSNNNNGATANGSGGGNLYQRRMARAPILGRNNNQNNQNIQNNNRFQLGGFNFNRRAETAR